MVRTKRILGIALALSLVWAAPAMAGKPDNPPGAGGREVIDDAYVICDKDPAAWLADACAIFEATHQRGEEDPDFLDVTGNNASRNEDALSRQAASAVLSLDDAVNFEKCTQYATAASYLVSYADKVDQLMDAGKLSDDMGLATQARDLAGELLSVECA